MGVEQPRAGWFRHMVSTVRFRVTAVSTLLAVVVLAGAGTALVVMQRRELTENIAEALADHADALEVVLSRPDGIRTATEDVADETFVQVADTSGRVLSESDNLGGTGPVAPAPPESEAEATTTVTGVPEDVEVSFVVSRDVATPGGPVVLHVGGAADVVGESTAILVRSLLVATPVAALLLAAVTWWLVGRTLAPVERIRAEVAAIDGTDLGRRVPEPRGDDEITRLAATMNSMLARVEESTTRRQQFVADASHELRSPLTRMRAELEVDVAHPDTADPAATRSSVLEEVVGLQHLVEDLLFLARSDAGASPVGNTPVDLASVVTAAARLVGADTSLVHSALVTGDPAQLRRAVGNLADNAARHASSHVAFELSTFDGRAVLAVVDDGPGIPPRQREEVFERFTRLDAARTVTSGGAGLGLAITRDIVTRHAGTVFVDPDYEGGARIVVSLPLRPDGLSGMRPGRR